MADIDIDFRVAKQIRDELAEGHALARMATQQIETYAVAAKQAWTHDDAKAVCDYLRENAATYDKLAKAIQDTITRLDTTIELFRQAQAERDARGRELAKKYLLTQDEYERAAGHSWVH